MGRKVKGICAVCGKKIYSNQPSRLVWDVDGKVKDAHERCANLLPPSPFQGAMKFWR